MTNMRSNLASFWRFFTHRQLASFGSTDHWSLALFPRRSTLVTLSTTFTGHSSLAPRPTPGPAGSSRAHTLPRWLLPHTDGRQPKGKDRTGPDLNERSLSFSMASNRAISTEKSIRFSSLAAVGPETIHSRPELNPAACRHLHRRHLTFIGTSILSWLSVISRNSPKRLGMVPRNSSPEFLNRGSREESP